MDEIRAANTVEDLSWRPFALKDTRALLEQGLLKGSLTRNRERFSREAALFETKRWLLSAREPRAGGELPRLLLAFRAEGEAPRHAWLRLHPQPELDLSRPDAAGADELREILKTAGYWRVSCLLDAALEARGAGRFLEALGFRREAELPDAFQSEAAPERGALWRWLLPENGSQVYFLPFGDGALVICGGEAEVERIYFRANGSYIEEDEVFLLAYREGLADAQRALRLNREGGTGPLGVAMRLAVAELRIYLQGGRKGFSFPFRAPEGTAFQREVWAKLREIPYGATQSYLELARRLSGGDEAKARKLTRAVGAACGANPLCVIYPCHRVIGSDLSLTGFGGGLDFKARLLDLELVGVNQGERDDADQDGERQD